MLTIVKTGLFDTIQDEGRWGYAALGINNNGVMDSYAMRVANALTGNDPQEAVLELHFPAAVIRFDAPALIAISGADFNPSIDGVCIPVNKAILIPAGSILSFNKKGWGLRCYLAVRGGFKLDKWLGSYATNLPAGTGGIHGAKLARDDRMAFRNQVTAPVDAVKIFQWKADSTSAYMDSHYLYFIKGPEWEWMNEASRHKFIQEPFTISNKSDRMAIRLQGENLLCDRQEQMVSSAVTMGTMQLLPMGQIFVLMADHQTSGGYPRVGNVITAHLPKIAQSGPGDYIHMLQVEQHTAEELLLSQLEELKILQMGCQFKLDSVMKTFS